MDESDRPDDNGKTDNHGDDAGNQKVRNDCKSTLAALSLARPAISGTNRINK